MGKYKLENLVTYDVYQKVGKQYIQKRVAICKPQHPKKFGYIKSIDGIYYQANMFSDDCQGTLAAINPRPVLARFGKTGNRFGDTVELVSMKFSKSRIILLQESINDEIEKNKTKKD